MNNLLIFFAIPLATIILSVILQKLIKRNPLFVAAIFFAIFLIITFAVLDETLWLIGLVLTIVYTIISYISALLSKLFCKLKRCFEHYCNEEREEAAEEESNNNCCKCHENNNQENVVLSANIMPNQNNNGRTGTFRGRYRRR